MSITLLASHFVGANFSHCSECSVAKALQGMYPSSIIREGVMSAIIDYKTVIAHEEYNREMFDVDLKKAEECGFSDQVKIREIETYDYQGAMESPENIREYSTESVL